MLDPLALFAVLISNYQKQMIEQQAKDRLWAVLSFPRRQRLSCDCSQGPAVGLSLPIVISRAAATAPLALADV